MVTRYVLVLMHWDRSGVKQCFGPYDTEAQAETARDQLKAMPAIENGEWDIKRCTDFGTAPAPISWPTAPAPMPSYPQPFWQSPVICTTNTSDGAE
jgi:hypothetical protein